MRRLLAIALLLGCACSASAEPVDVAGIAYREQLGAHLPDTVLTDETGAPSRLASGRPIILVPGYFNCPSLCGVVRADLLDALGHTGLVAGRDYDLDVVSIDPAETARDAASAKMADMARYPLPGAATGWHYLTGDASAVERAIGFDARFDPALKQFIHPAGIVMVTPGGVVARYLLGVGYRPRDIADGIAWTAHGDIAMPESPVLLLCFHYDPVSGKYSTDVMKLLRLFAALTVATIGGALFLAFRR